MQGAPTSSGWYSTWGCFFPIYPPFGYSLAWFNHQITKLPAEMGGVPESLGPSLGVAEGGSYQLAPEGGSYQLASEDVA